MAKYTGTVKLYVNEFEAGDLKEAHKMIDEYIDALADTFGELNWESVDFEVEEA